MGRLVREEGGHEGSYGSRSLVCIQQRERTWVIGNPMTRTKQTCLGYVPSGFFGARPERVLASS